MWGMWGRLRVRPRQANYRKIGSLARRRSLIRKTRDATNALVGADHVALLLGADEAHGSGAVFMTWKRRFLLSLCALCVGLLTQLSPSLADKRVALVIGNANYKNTPALANPANDASDVAQALKAIGFEVTLAIDVDKRQMDQALAQFARASTKADASLFYYAGHGMQYQGRNYIMPADASLEDEISLRYELTSIEEVKAALERSNGVRIMVLDACRNNPLAQRLVRSITVNTRDIPNVQGYARPEKTQGMVVIYATQADDVANDGVGRNSPFSTAFLKEIKEPGLEIGTMFRRIGEDVYQATNGRQSPELSISMVPEYYLNQAETDQAIWARIRVSADADTIREFLNRYPNSFYAPDAKARLDLLDQAAREKTAAQQLEKQKQDAAAAEAARLKQDQADRERIAAAAQAREQELAAKLAAAEAERQRMAAELAEKTKAQSDVDQRQQSERAKADEERLQHEAALRAEIEQRKAASSQLEKDRLLQEALAKDREKQIADEKAAAERDRIAKENADRELQAQQERALALKAEVARLEQDAAQAKANAAAEAQKAADAQKAASAAEKTAALTPPSQPASREAFSPEQAALVAPIQTELQRLGCYFGNEDWNSAAMKRGVARFAQYAKLAAAPDAPSASLLDDLKARRDRVCPSECSLRETEVGGRCVAKTCGRGEILSRTGACVAKPAAPREAVANAAPKAREISKGRCFSFNGNQYCE